MKNRLLPVAAAIFIATATTMNIDAQTAKTSVPPYIHMQGGVGPVIAGGISVNSLPERAKKIIKKIGQPVASCENEYMTNEYDVALSSGVELEFDSRGYLLEIESPEHGSLGNDLVKLMLPGKVYRHLEKLELDQYVTSISADNDGYKVEFNMFTRYDDAFFNHKGDLIAVHYN